MVGGPDVGTQGMVTGERGRSSLFVGRSINELRPLLFSSAQEDDPKFGNNELRPLCFSVLFNISI